MKEGLNSAALFQLRKEQQSQRCQQNREKLIAEVPNALKQSIEQGAGF